jgi:hypothetical protein
MLKLYFEKIFKDKTSEELEPEAEYLWLLTSYCSKPTDQRWIRLATASFVATGINLNLNLVH